MGTSHLAWLWSAPADFDHIVWSVVFAFVSLLFAFATARNIYRVKEVDLGFDAVEASNAWSNLFGTLSSVSLLAHECVWLTHDKNLRFLLRLPFVLIGIQMTVMFYIMHDWDIDKEICTTFEGHSLFPALSISLVRCITPRSYNNRPNPHWRRFCSDRHYLSAKGCSQKHNQATPSSLCRRVVT